MEISQVSQIMTAKHLSSLHPTSTVQCKLSPEVDKIDQWVEMLQQMPDCTRHVTHVTPDAGKIAQAMLERAI